MIHIRYSVLGHSLRRAGVLLAGAGIPLRVFRDGAKTDGMQVAGMVAIAIALVVAGMALERFRSAPETR